MAQPQHRLRSGYRPGLSVQHAGWLSPSAAAATAAPSNTIPIPVPGVTTAAREVTSQSAAEPILKPCFLLQPSPCVMAEEGVEAGERGE